MPHKFNTHVSWVAIPSIRNLHPITRYLPSSAAALAVVRQESETQGMWVSWLQIRRASLLSFRLLRIVAELVGVFRWRWKYTRGEAWFGSFLPLAPVCGSRYVSIASRTCVFLLLFSFLIWQFPRGGVWWWVAEAWSPFLPLSGSLRLFQISSLSCVALSGLVRVLGRFGGRVL